MSSAEYRTVHVRILDRDYGMACGPGEEEALRASAKLVDERLRDIRLSGKVMGIEKMLVMAAINIAHELVRGQDQVARQQLSTEKRLAALTARADAALVEIRDADL